MTLLGGRVVADAVSSYEVMLGSGGLESDWCPYEKENLQTGTQGGRQVRKRRNRAMPLRAGTAGDGWQTTRGGHVRGAGCPSALPGGGHGASIVDGRPQD